LHDVWRRLSPPEQKLFLARLDRGELSAWLSDWAQFSHWHQRPPGFAQGGGPWRTWLILGGRGAGKTRAGAQWVRAMALGEPPYAERPARRIALIGESEHEVREVMIEGVSGLLAAHRLHERPTWIPSRRRIEWGNGAVAQAFSAEDPEGLRGSQFDAAWADELAKWRHAEATFDVLQFALRLGEHPRQVITTTPRPIALLKKLTADPSTALTRAGTRANARFLSRAFIDHVLERYAGTRVGRQEIDGEIVEDRPEALWSRALIEACRVAAAPPLARVVVAVDPPVSSGKGADACGLVAAGRSEEGTVYVIADETVSGLSPAGWAARAIALWRRLDADALIVEVNQGGEMVRAVLRTIDPSVPVKEVHATRGKYRRAEPIAAMYAQGSVRHVGAAFALLEDEMCAFGIDGLAGGGSPDRLDALVWAVTELTGRSWYGPRIRCL
jgi:phage terminase large subunit-like protein